MMSSRIVFLLGTLIAIAGTGEAAVSTCTGAANTVYNTENNPGGTGVIACRCVNGYTAATDAIVVGDVTLTCTKCAAGYYFSAGSDTATAVCTQAPANKYHAGLKDLTSGYTAQTPSDCPSNSESAAGSAAIADCKVKAGYWISAAHASTPTIVKVPQNSYGPGGESAVTVDADLKAATKVACPFAGTTAADTKTAVTDCTPSCGTGTNAVAQGGTCVCAANYFGMPVSANPLSTATAATQGCNAAGFTITSTTYTTNKIAFTAHGLVAQTALQYYKGSGAALKQGGTDIADGTTVFVLAVNTNDFTISATPGGAALVLTAGNAAQYFTIAGLAVRQHASTAIGSNKVTARAAHTFVAGDQVKYYSGGSTAATDATGGSATAIADGATYFIKTVADSETTFTLAATPGGTVITLAAGHADNYYVKQINVAAAGFVQTAVIGSEKFTFADHGLADNTVVIYNNGGGATATNLVHGDTYFVRDSTTNDFKVNTVKPQNAAIAIAGGGATQFFTPVGTAVLFASTASNVITTLAHGFVVGDQVTYYGGGGAALKQTPSGGSATAIPDGTQFFIKTRPLTTTFTLAATPGGAEIVLTVGNVANYFVKAGVKGFTVPQSGVAVTSDTITSTAHGLSNGDRVTYNQVSTGTLMAPLVNGQTYFVVSALTNSFKLAATLGGSAIDITDDGHDLQYFTTIGVGPAAKVAYPGGACPPNTESAAGTTTLAGCTVKAGYHIATKASHVAFHRFHPIGKIPLYPTGLVVSAAPADYYGLGGAAASEQIAASVTATKTACPFGGNTNSVTGKAALTDCIPQHTTNAGGCGAASVNAKAVGGTCVCKANYYGSPLDSGTGTSGQATQGCDACPFGGSSSDGATAVTDCTPACGTGTNAVAQGGTCVCAATNYGTPVSANPFLTAAAATQGCASAAGFTITSTTYTTNKIAFTAHGLAAQTALQYYKGSGAALKQGGTDIADGTTVFVLAVTANDFTISATPGGAVLVLTAGNAAQYFTPAGYAVRQHASTAIGTNKVTARAAHTFVAGDQVKYYSGGSTAATDATGGSATAIADGATYFIKTVADSDTTFTLAATPGGTVITLAAGHADNYYVKAGVKGVKNHASTTVASNEITTIAAHLYNVGDEIKVYSGGAAKLKDGGVDIVDGTTYYIQASGSGTTFKLAATRGGSVVTLTAGNVANYFTSVTVGSATNLPYSAGACPTNSETTPAATTYLGDCKVKAGYYVATKSTSVTDVASIAISQVPANSYAAGGEQATVQATASVTATKTACPFGGTSPAGSTLVEDCVPDCGASTVNALNARGTCICAPNYYGTPTSLVTVAQTAVNTGTNVITVTAHGFADGDQVTYNQVSSGTLMAPLADATTYYVRDATANTFKLASTSGGTALVITNDGHDAQTFTPANAKATGGCTACPINTEAKSDVASTAKTHCKVKAGYYMQRIVIAESAVTIGTDLITASSHGLSDGDQVTYNQVSSGTLMAPLADGTIYYVRDATANDFKLAATSGGTALDISNDGHDTQFFTNVLQVPANSYGPGGEAADQTVTNTITATKKVCPHAGTSAAGSDALADCVPDCGATSVNAVALGGTCVCKPTHYGEPTPINAAATGGCTVCTAGKYIQTAYVAADGGAASSTDAATLATDASDCIVQPGFYISTESSGTNALGSLDVDQVVANSYTVAIAADTRTASGADTSAACPYAGTTVQAGGGLSDCTPSCGSGINTVAVGGTCRCASTHYGIPQDVNGYTTGAATGGCTACPTNSETAYTATASPGGTVADCKVKAGYYISAFKTTAPFATIIQTPAGKYYDGNSAANAGSNDTPTTCAVKSTSAAGSNTKSDCKTDAGYYLSVASPSATGEGRIAKAEANKWSAGGTSISTITAETPTACTYGSTSPIGSDAVADCTSPLCGTVAVASSGTCVCKAGRTGTPTPTTGAVTGGCTATLCAANQKVTSNACAACGAGTNNAAGDDASGADTTCDAISCTADHYVSSNVCTDCAAGSTNAAGDDASGADTACDIVSGASPLEVKLTSMISFLVIGFLALAM